jgi:aspartate carbamoyltransferase catalytic subunit
LRHLLDLQNMQPDDLRALLQRARDLPLQPRATLEGRLVGALSDEHPSVPLELAARCLGSTVQPFPLTSSAADLRALGVDLAVVRSSVAGAPHRLATPDLPILNGGDGAHEAPLDAVADLLAIQRDAPEIDGLEAVLVGDILHSGPAKSLMWGLLHLGARVRLCGPPALVPEALARSGATVVHSRDAALARAGLVVAFPPSPALQARNFFPSMSEYRRLYGVTPTIRRAPEDALRAHLAVLEHLLGAPRALAA